MATTRQVDRTTEEYDEIRRVLDEYRRAQAMLKLVRQESPDKDTRSAGRRVTSRRGRDAR